MSRHINAPSEIQNNSPHPLGGWDEYRNTYKPVDPALWGKDHWSMLGYLMTLAVDQKAIEWARCRLNRERMDDNRDEGLFASILRQRMGGMGWDPKHGTRLTGYWLPKVEGEEKRGTDPALLIPTHDDFDCMVDFAQCGEHGYPPIILYEPKLWAKNEFHFTEIGRVLGAKVLDLKAQGLMFNDITVEKTLFTKTKPKRTKFKGLKTPDNDSGGFHA